MTKPPIPDNPFTESLDSFFGSVDLSLPALILISLGVCAVYLIVAAVIRRGSSLKPLNPTSMDLAFALALSQPIAGVAVKGFSGLVWGTIIGSVAFLIGITLVLMELFLHPGTILPGVIGVVLMVGSLIWAMIDRWPSESWWPTSEMLVRPLVNLSLAAAAGFVAVYLLAKILPKTSFYHRIVLTAAEPSGPGVSIPLERTRLTAGEAGRARTTTGARLDARAVAPGHRFPAPIPPPTLGRPLETPEP